MFADFFRGIVENSPDGYIVLDRQGRILEVNQAYLRRSGYSREELLAMRIHDLDAKESSGEIEEHIAMVVREGSDLFETLHRDKDGTVWEVEVSTNSSASGDFLFNQFRDIRRRKRQKALLQIRHRLSELFADCTLELLMQIALDEAELFTGSKIGFFHLMDDDRETVKLAAWSTNTLQSMCAMQGDGLRYPATQAGVWAECLRTREPAVRDDYRSLPGRKGLHPGQPLVLREAVVPVIRNGKVLAILGVGNKGAAYDETDVETLRQFSSLVMDFIVHKQAEDALRRSHALLDSIINSSTDLIFVKDRQLRNVLCNEIFARELGKRPSDLVGKTDIESGWSAEFVKGDPGRGIRGYEQGDREALEGESVRGLEQHMDASGKLRSFDSVKVPLRNEYGEIAGVLGIARDITESTRAGEMLKEREFWLRESQMAGRVGSFDYDVAARRWSCTEAMDEIFGLPDGFDKTTEGWLSLIVECDRERMKDYHDEVIRNRATDFFEEYRLRRPVDGVERWIQIRGRFSFAPDGEPMRLIGTVFDIHDRRQAEEMLKVSESRFADIADHSQEWIWETDAAGRYSYSSRAVESMLGFTPVEIRQKSFLDLFHPHDREVSARRVLEAMSSQQAFRNLTCGVANRLGKLVWLSSSGLPFRDKDGNLLGYRGVSTDITERRLLEEKLRQSQKMEAVGQLAGGVAHDFNNILSAMMMHIHVLKGRPEASPEIRDGLGEINVHAGQAANLTRQLLLFSRQSVMQTRALRLDELVDNLLKMVRRLIGENITLVFEQGGTSPEVEADAGMLEQVIMNLMVNSRDAMPGGGRITISTKHAEIDGEQVAENPLRREGYFVMLTVSDTGCGMDSATRKRIFEPFFTTKEPGKGTGLGLATVHGIVAQHGGWIEVTSRRDHGTTFRIYLPVSDKPVPETGEDGPRAIPGGDETILVVEDDPGVRKFLVLNLRELGYRVHEAANGHDALRLFREHREQIALLLTDMVMPGGLTGLELAEKALAERPDLKVIVSSGYSKAFAGSARRDFGDVAFLQKPYDVPLLASMLRDCFRPR